MVLCIKLLILSAYLAPIPKPAQPPNPNNVPLSFSLRERERELVYSQIHLSRQK